MSKKIALRAGKSPFQPLSAEATALQGVSASNVGNMIFSESAFKILSTPNVSVIPKGYNIHKLNIYKINEQYDAIVLPFANAFRLQWKEQLNAYTEFVSKLKIPVIVMGVGIQTDFDYNLNKLSPIEKETKKLVSAILDRSASIGVRGEATKAFLNKLGFRDEYIDVIGCPSMFRYGRDFYIDLAKLNKKSSQSNYALNITGPGFDNFGFKVGKEKIASIIDFNIDKYSSSDVILQNNYSLITMLFGRGISLGTEYDGVSLDATKVLDGGRAKQFVDPSPWIKFLSNKDFSLGSRIHGNIAALLAGTPCFVLSTDSRTRELCEFFHIPFQYIDQVKNYMDVEEFKCQADYSRLISNYNYKFDNFINFLDKNGLDNCFYYKGFAENFENELSKIKFSEPVSGVKLDSNSKYLYKISCIKHRIYRKLSR